MNKKIIIVITLFALTVLLACCNDYKAPVSKSINEETTPEWTLEEYNSEDLPYGEIFKDEETKGIFGLINGRVITQKYIYHSEYEADAEFYMHDLVTGKIDTLGRLKRFRLGTGDLTVVGDCAYATLCTGTLFSMHDLEHNLVELDLKNKKVNVLSTEKLGQTRVDTKGVYNQVLSLEARMTQKKDIGKTYLESYNADTKTTSVLCEKEINTTTPDGESIQAFSCNNGKVYAFIALDSGKYNLEIYDINGNLERTINGDSLFTYLTQMVTKINVIDNYIYIRNLQHETIICEIGETELIPVIIGVDDVKISIAKSLKETYGKYAVFGSYNAETASDNIVFLDTENAQLIYCDPLSAQTQKDLSGLFVDENDIIYNVSINNQEEQKRKWYLSNVDEILKYKVKTVALNLNNPIVLS